MNLTKTPTANHFKAPPKSTNQQPTPSTSRGTIKLLKAILLAGLYPNVGWISELKDGKKKLMNKGDVCEVVVDGKDSLKIHPSSVNRTLDVCGTWIAFQDKVGGRGCVVRDITHLQHFSPIIFYIHLCSSTLHQYFTTPSINSSVYPISFSPTIEPSYHFFIPPFIDPTH